MGREGTECILEREEKEKKSYVLTDRRCPNLTITIKTLAVSGITCSAKKTLRSDPFSCKSNR